MIRKLTIYLIGLIGFAACTDLTEIREINEIQSDAAFALPLVNSEISITEALESFDDNSSLLVDSDGLLRFTYEGDRIVISSQEVFTTVNEALPPLIPVTDTVVAYLVTSPEIKIDVLTFKNGRIEYTFFNSNSNAVEVVLSLPQFFDNDNKQLSDTIVVRPFENVLDSFSLKDVRLIPEDDSLYIEYQALESTGRSVSMDAFFLLPKELDYTYAEGILGSQVFIGEEDTLDVEYYENWTQGEVFFEEPTVTVHIENSFGFPAIAIAKVFDILTLKDDRLPIQGEYVDDGFSFNFPTFDEIGQSKFTSFEFNRDNSNVIELVSANPTAFIYAIDIINNPDLTTIGYITDSSFFAYRVDAAFPFNGSLKDFVNRDTTAVDFTSYDNVEAIDFKIVSRNTIPLQASLQGFFLDSNGAIIEQLLPTSSVIIGAAEVAATDQSTVLTEQETFIELDANRFQNIRKATDLVLVTTFATTGNGDASVKVTSDQTLAIKIGAIVKQ